MPRGHDGSFEPELTGVDEMAISLFKGGRVAATGRVIREGSAG